MSAKKNKSDAEISASGDGNNSGAGGKPECFIIMPISDPDGYEAGHFMHVYKDILVPACEKAGFQPLRADQVRPTNLINLDILQRLLDSPMALCDLSSRNPNVLFELGLRQAFDMPVTLVQEVGTPSIFDIASLRITPYRKELIYHEVLEDQTVISSVIKATKSAEKDSKSINSIIQLLSITHGAKLKKLGEEDKEVGMLQVLRAELNNTKSEIMRRLQSFENTQKPIPETGVTSVEPRANLIYYMADQNFHPIRNGARVYYTNYGEGVARYMDSNSIEVAFDSGVMASFMAEGGRFVELKIV